MGWQWHHLDHMQIICTSLQSDNHASTSPLVFTGRMPFLLPNQRRESTESISMGTTVLGLHNTAKNSSDTLPSYPPDSQQC